MTPIAIFSLVLAFATLAYFYPLVALGWVLVACIVTPWIARELREIGREYDQP